MNLSFKILLITLSSVIIAFGSFAILNSETINFNKTNDIFQARAERKCTFCHSDKIKYKYVHPASEDDCENCHQPTGKKHPKSNVKGFTLASQMPDLCYNCHESKSDKKYVHTPIKAKGCLSCHSPHGSSNKSLLIKNPDNRFCQNCHNLKIARNDVVHAPVEFSECTDCHDSHQSNNLNLLTESKPQLCYTCHDDLKNAGTKKYVHPAFEDDCGNCHMPHNSLNQNLLTEKTPNLCYECHSDIQDEIKLAKTVHLPVKDTQNCSNCHSPHASDNNNILLKSENALCLSCHNDTISTEKGTIPNIKKHLEESTYIHEPVKDNCINCHKPHTSENNFLLSEAFPSKEYVEAKPENFAVCFECHDSGILTEKRTEDVTNFRNGNQNLHYLHIHGEKGRSCVFCHDVHAAKNKFLVKKRVSFGTWVMPMKFTYTKTGGSCGNGCHSQKKYDRVNPINYLTQTEDTTTNNLNINDTINVNSNPNPVKEKDSSVILKDEIKDDTIKADNKPVINYQNTNSVIDTSESKIINDTVNIENDSDIIVGEDRDSVVISKNEIQEEEQDNSVKIENKSVVDTILPVKISAEKINVDTVEVQNDNIKKDTSEIINSLISAEAEFKKISSVKVYFETAKFNINTRYRKEILQIFNFLEKYPDAQIIIQGHTDNIGSYGSNIILAQKRAKAVREFLILKGILPQRLKLEIYGESKPCNTNSTEKGRALNRRVEFKLNTK